MELRTARAILTMLDGSFSKLYQKSILCSDLIP
jgi:hypothetical protein